jgi:hypothetical protein
LVGLCPDSFDPVSKPLQTPIFRMSFVMCEIEWNLLNLIPTFGPTDNFGTWYIDVSTGSDMFYIFSLFSHCTHPSNVSNRSNQSAIWSSLKLPRLVSCSIVLRLTA